MGSESDLSGLENRYFLVTHHNTIVYFDAAVACLRHAPFGSAPLNVVLELAGSRGRLLLTDDFCTPAGQVWISGSAVAVGPYTASGDSEYDIESLAEESIGIRAGNSYLSSDLDGEVRHNREWCREWEQHRLVRADTVYGLAQLWRHRWLSSRDRRINSLATQPAKPGYQADNGLMALSAALAAQGINITQELTFGPSRVQLMGRVPSFILEKCGEDPAARLHIEDAPGNIHTFSKFSPLIYYCVYGNASYYECLRLSLESLAQYGCFDGTIGVACDRPRHELMPYIPEIFHGRLIVTKASRERGWFNRYYLEHDLYQAFQPILYCDVDVIFDANVLDMLIEIALCQKLCCATEAQAHPQLAKSTPRAWNDVGNYFGRYLYASDPEFFDSHVQLGNSGVLGFDNVARIKPVNELVQATAARQSADRLKTFTDQPVLNYVLHKTGSGNFDILNRFCRMCRKLEDVPVGKRRGLVHFHLASGGATKAEMMKAYLQALEKPVQASEDRQEPATLI